MRYYRIFINGYGGESVYGKITKEQYEFWSNHEKLEELGFEDGEGAINEYFWDQEEHEDKVPEEARFEASDWYEMDDIEHSNGVTSDSARVSIEEYDGGEWESQHVTYFLEGDLQQLITEQDIDVDEGILDLDEHQDKEGHCYVFYGMSVEKGSFVDATVEIPDGEEFDISKLNFSIMEMPNGDNIVSDVTYNGEYLDNQGGDTTGKAMYMEVWDY